jgi:aldose 1-epimerase
MDDSRYTVEQVEIDGVEVYVLREHVMKTEARIAPGVGNNCYSFGFEFKGEWIDIIDPPPDMQTLKNRPTAYGNPILFPFPNRIRGGKFTFEGKEYQFDKPANSPTSIHGLLLTRPYHVDSAGATADAASIVCRLDSREFPDMMRQYPFPFEIRVAYTLKASVLTMETRVKNLGDKNMPMGYGIHPYFRAPLSSKSSPEKCLITAPTAKYWELDKDLVPTGKTLDVEGRMDLRNGKPFAGMKLDDVFTDVIRSEGVSRCIIDDTEAGLRMVLESDGQFRELVVYTPPNRPSICFEPYTCPTDAINLEARGINAGVIVLKPGEEFTGTVRMIAETK